MSKIRKLKMERIIPRLKEVLRVATMKTAQFGGLPISFPILPKTQKEVDRFVKEITELWRNSWLVEPLEKIIKEIEYEINR